MGSATSRKGRNYGATGRKGNSLLGNTYCSSEAGDRRGFPGGPVVKNPPANAGDMGSILVLGRSHMPRDN